MLGAVQEIVAEHLDMVAHTEVVVQVVQVQLILEAVVRVAVVAIPM